MPASRRITFLDHCAAWSGGEIALLRLVEALDPATVSVVLGEDGPLVGALEDAGIDVRVVPLAARTNRLDRGAAARVPLTSIVDVARYVLQLRRVLREDRPDVVHCNSLKSGIYGCLAARLAGVPVVWHVRDRIAPDYLPTAVVRLVRFLLLVLPDLVLVNSETTRATLGPVVRRVVPHHVLDDPYRPTRDVSARTTPADPPRVALIGRLSPWKGQQVFLDAVESLQSKGIRVDARLYGSALFGEDEYADQVVRRARSVGVRVDSFAGDVGEVLADLDVVVNASVIPEPFGQVVVEAIAHGVPVVVPDAGGPAEIVRDGVDGATFRSGDGAALAETLVAVLHSDELYARLSAGGLRRAEDYRPDHVAGRFVELMGGVRRRSLPRRLRGSTADQWRD